MARVDFENDLWVKFRDALKIRASNGSVGSLVGSNVSAIETVRANFGLTFSPSIQLPAVATLIEGVAPPTTLKIARILAHDGSASKSNRSS